MAEFSNYVEARNFVVGALDGAEKMAGSKNGSSAGWTTQQVANLAAASSFIDGETPTGDIDGINDTYTLGNVPISGSARVYLNGLRTTAFTIVGTTLTFTSPPEEGDSIIVDYRITV